MVLVVVVEEVVEVELEAAATPATPATIPKGSVQGCCTRRSSRSQDSTRIDGKATL